ncbi:MAG: UvrD-helicase domain-containing protein [Chloroflexi bacterium]|nr:UvrD-helicase domain-containing protein [Chloroflexota bacterium]
MSDPFTRIRESLRESLFVEAGAGTGKTKALVDRLVALVEAGIAVTEIVAITFTEKAAAELRERVRAELEKARSSGGAPARLAAALESLDAAPISTIHAFAAGLVRGFAAEAGVDPDFSVIDEVAAGRRFEQRWREELEHLGGDPAACEAFARVLRLGLTPDSIETFARELWQRPDFARRALAAAPPLPPTWPDLRAWSGDFRAELAGARPAATAALRLASVQNLLDLLTNAGPEEREALLAGSGLADLRFGAGNSETKPVIALAKQIQEDLGAVLDGLRAEALHAILPATASFVLRERTGRCRDGALTFDDLISLARDLVTDNSDVRERLRSRYHTFLIDEFQDTDP